MRAMRNVLVLAVAAVALSGCNGERLGDFTETNTANGRWTLTGQLIRSYDVPLQSAMDTITKWYESSGSLMTDRRLDRDGSHAVIDGRLKNGVSVEWEIWAKANGPTDVGVKVGEGDQKASSDLLNTLERSLPGKRIGAGQ